MRKKMTFLLVMLLGVTLNTLAQGFGIAANYNSAKLKKIYDGNVQPENSIVHFESLSGFGVELNYDLELGENLYGEIGLSYQVKGLKEVASGEGANDTDLEMLTKINYLQIPLHIRYNYEVGDETYLFGFGGFDIGFATGGTYTAGDYNEDIKFGSSESDDYSSSDFGLTFGAGVLYNNIELRLGFSNGLSDIDPSKAGEAYNRVFFVGMGYRFNN